MKELTEQTSELFLARGIPDVEHDGTARGVENQGMNLHAQSGNVFFLEFASHVSRCEGEK